MDLAPVYAVGWASQMSSPLYIDSDHVLDMHRLRGSGRTTFALSAHRGPVWVSVPIAFVLEALEG